MAHFAQIDDNNIVINVLSVPDEQEHRGQEYLSENLGFDGRWIQTSYNHKIRKNFAGVGYVYNEDLDIFMPPKPYPSWIINSELGIWESPIPYPQLKNNEICIWDEDKKTWKIELLPMPI